jgi:sterol carrier protein 2
MSVSRVHVAGIGLSFSSQQDITNGAIDAGARALLDAGITYAKVQLSVACSLENSQASVPRECFKAFGRQKAPVCSMDSHSALHIVAQCIRTGQTDCAILVGLDKVSKIATIMAICHI